MEQREFGEGLALLKGFYTNWNLDLKNVMVISIWYENFKHLDMTSFQTMIKQYCMTNRFPPNSPFDLLDAIPKLYSVDEAWEIVLDAIRRSKDNSMFLNIMFKNQALYPFVKHFDIDNVEEDSYGNKCYGYSLGKRFKREYQEMLNQHSIMFVGNQIICNTQNQRLLT